MFLNTQANSAPFFIVYYNIYAIILFFNIEILPYSLQTVKLCQATCNNINQVFFHYTAFYLFYKIIPYGTMPI